MKTKLILSSIISAQLAFTHLAIAQSTQVDCGDKLTYSNTAASNLVGAYIQSQKERFGELQNLLKEANKLKNEIDKNANTTETVGKVYKYIGVISVIGSLVFGGKTASSDLTDGVIDIFYGDHMESKAKNLKLQADNQLKEMIIFLMNEEKSLNDLIQKHSKQECISIEEYSTLVSSYKKQALDRVTSIESFLKNSKQRVEKIKSQRNIKVGAKGVGMGVSLLVLYWGAQLASSKSIGLFQLAGLPTMLVGGSGVVGFGASIYSDINSSEESINQIQAIADNRLREIEQIKSLLQKNK